MRTQGDGGHMGGGGFVFLMYIPSGKLHFALSAHLMYLTPVYKLIRIKSDMINNPIKQLSIINVSSCQSDTQQVAVTNKSYNNSHNKGENPIKPEKISDIISGGEGLTVEFKQSRTKLNRDVFETVCAF